ncbi:MAG: restriction endonuclease subunit S [Phycisphaerales bacterium]|nr:restriction endonuclease subunit S [Phycisphaerales bacterium]
MTYDSIQLEQIADVFPGHYEKGAGADDPSGSHRLVYIGSIDSALGHKLLLDKCPRFTPKSDPKNALLRDGDLVIPARGERQTVACIAESENGRSLIAASFLHVIRPKPDTVDSVYLAWWLNQFAVQSRIAETVSGSNMPFLPLSATRGIRVSLPSLAIQRKIADLYSMSIKEHELATAIRDLRLQLVDALALRAINGATA